MQDFLLTHYDWLRALHVIAVVSFMAGMLYLPRLFVYHANAPKGGELSETLKIMERRLMRAIINPAAIVMVVIGGLMIWVNPELMKGGWMHAKLTLVFLMFGCHGAFSKWRKQFANDQNTRPDKFYRIWNEIPTVLMIAIIILVIVKPF
ncbi:MAG: TIGR00701 family protein [Alphaproteobacteria bacterium RIFCSPHIGHO2_02_FULL_46_13]|nr:MAG: TIGR00701 family protein [Alphaproteobacteria bacterium RIFCSPHIGHO2_02_FULL_46_13]